MQERRAFYVIFAIAAALIIPAALTLRTVIHPVILQATSDNPTPLGYTWSLLLFIIPIAALGWWFASRSDLQFPRKAFWRTLAVLDLESAGNASARSIFRDQEMNPLHL